MLFTAVDCPYSNGLNERLNQMLVNRLRCKINENSKNKKIAWSTLFDQCVRVYNDTVHTVTRYSPNYLMNGIRSPFLNKIQNKVINSLNTDRKIAFQNSQKNHFINKKRFDRNKKELNFSIGQYVYISHGNALNRNKLDELRNGPFKITDRISNCLFRVAVGFQKAESNVFHVSKLYPC